MPPTNSPARPERPDSSVTLHYSLLSPPTPARTPSPSTFLHTTAPTLSSPVLDLASTLTVEAEDDIDQDNVDFLRRPPQEELPADALTRELRGERRRMNRVEAELRERSWARVQQGTSSQERTMADLRNLSEAEARERRLHQRRMAELRAAMDRRWNQASSRAAAGPYATDENTTNELYNWAPPAHDDSNEAEQLETIMTELRAQQPNTHPDVLNVLSRAQLDANRDYRRRNSGQAPTQPHEPSLRSAAILQSVRRHRIASTQQDLASRQRAYLQSYIAAHEDVARQAADDNQEADENGEDRTQRAEDSLTFLDAMRLEVQGESSRSSRNVPDSESTPSSLLRNLRLHREARESTPRPESGIWQDAYGRRYPSAEARRVTASPDDMRRLYLNNPRVHGADLKDVNLEFKRAIEIVDALQDPNIEDLAAVLRSHDYGLASRHVTFDHLEQLRARHRVPPTSYLQSGAHFFGSQSDQGYQSQPPANRGNATIIGPSEDSNPSATPWLRESGEEQSTSTPQISASPNPISRSTSGGLVKPPQCWTVKVSIHDVDYETMTLRGTMEAFDVPSMTQVYAPPASRPNPHISITPSSNVDPSSPDHPTDTYSQRTLIDGKTSFSTFLEGEIIDFAQHTLLTPASTFASTDASRSPPDSISQYDALYWRKLEPFASLSDDRLAAALLNTTWLKEELLGKYVLMRWKERCFVAPTSLSTSALRAPGSSPPQPASAATPVPRQQPQQRPADASTTSIAYTPDGNGYGLSISGFYYVSMRRADGRCQGLYYDPQSSPYQHLELGVVYSAPSSSSAAPGGGRRPAWHGRERVGGMWGVGTREFR